MSPPLSTASTQTGSNDRSDAPNTTLEQLLARYERSNAGSRALFERAQRVLPGGNTRTGVYFAPFPVYAQRGEGPYLYDVDGNRRLDFVNNASALILGHAHPAVVAALQEQAAQGTAFFAPTAAEIELAELLQQRLPSLERLRFCSSGTEAVLNTLRVARAATGRPRIAKFEGAYHGIDDPAMISYLPPLGDQLGPAERPAPVVSSAGLAPGTADSVLVLPFNDADGTERLLREHGAELAAVIIDPLSTAAGMTTPATGFLERLRAVTGELGIVLIFDEIVSLRASAGGAQELYGVRPDLTCLAKVVAGGTPGGAFGGRADLLALYDPTDGAPQIPQSGTYNGNPLVTAAGLATLRTMTAEAYRTIHDRTTQLAAALQGAFDSAGVAATVLAIGSLFRIYFLPALPCNYREAALDDAQRQRWLYFWLLEQGMVTRTGGNVSLAMDDDHVQLLVDAVAAGAAELAAGAAEA